MGKMPSGSSQPGAVCILGPEYFGSGYTAAMLRVLCEDAGVVVVKTPEEAGALWVSVNDPDSLNVLKRARRIARGRPVIMGGHEGYNGVPYLAWADMVVAGEATDFIYAWGEGGADSASGLDCVLTRDKWERGETFHPCYEVPYASAPLVRIGGKQRIYYYLAGRGCPTKCKFCSTSWTQPASQAPNGSVRGAIRETTKMGGQLNLISNDSISERASCVVVASVRVRDYLADPARWKTQMIRLGIEGWTEKARIWFGKPIRDADIRELVHVTSAARQQMELFFLVGYPGWAWEHISEFVDMCIPPGLPTAPKAMLKLTYFEPKPHTPLANVGIYEAPCPTKDVFYQFWGHNRRFRTFQSRNQIRAAWRTVLSRCTPDQAVLLGADPGWGNELGAWHRWCAHLEDRGLLGLMGPQKKNVNDCIVTRTR